MNLAKANFNGKWDEEKKRWRDGADLSCAKFNGADLCMAEFNDASLWDLEFNGVEFNGADLFLAKFNGANLIGAKFNGANLWDAEFNGANLINADFSDTKKFDFFPDERRVECKGNEGLKRKFKDCYCLGVEENFPKVPEGFEVRFVFDENGEPKPHPTLEGGWLIEILEKPLKIL